MWENERKWNSWNGGESGARREGQSTEGGGLGDKFFRKTAFFKFMLGDATSSSSHSRVSLCLLHMRLIIKRRGDPLHKLV
jgi:hypothetical protein